MQRLFTMFPGGAPGLALVLLRLCVAGGLWQPILAGGPAWDALRLFGVCTVSVLLLTGFATPLVSLIASGMQLMKVLDPARIGSLLSAEAVALTIFAVSALSLLLIGPGAFSMDARLFGRKVLTSS